MVDLFALVKRSVFERCARDAGHSPDSTGFTFDWTKWSPTSQPIVERLKRGGRVWAVTVRPEEKLLLTAVFENPKVTYDRHAEEYDFKVRDPNLVPVTDITDLIPRITFENGSKILTTPGKLAQGLQTIRVLSAESVKLLEKRGHLFRRSAGDGMNDRRIGDGPKDLSAREGRRYLAEIERRRRDSKLTQQRLHQDQHTCQNCGFSAASVGLDIGSPVVEVHHIYPMRDRDGETETKITELVTLCPTCHRVAHALAAWHKSTVLDLKLLRRFYPRATPLVRSGPG